ncbi:MAG: glycosyltransferase [Desulfuromonadales bacterium]
MIPKKIHYCWFGCGPLPKLVRKCIQTWEERLPEYEFNLWNEENSPMDIPYVKAAYKNKKFAFVSDYVRCWAIYNNGGIYLDTDMYVLKNFDNLLNNHVFFGYEKENQNIISAGIIGCEKKSLFVRKIIDRYENMEFSVDELWEITIPKIITDEYEKFSSKESISIFPYDYFYPYPLFNRDKQFQSFIDYKTQNTYAIHLWNQSWFSRKDYFQKKFNRCVEKIKNFCIGKGTDA